jgi:hypothetical protein
MSFQHTPWMDDTEELLAEIAESAYRVLLRHGLSGSFLEAELELWSQVRATYYRHTTSRILSAVNLGRPAPLPALAEVDAW